MTASDHSIKGLAKSLRQSLQTCSAHTIGPLASYMKCLDLKAGGFLSDSQFKEVGQEIVNLSLETIAKYKLADAEEDKRLSLIYRERCVIHFAIALFGLSDDALPRTDRLQSQKPLKIGVV